MKKPNTHTRHEQQHTIDQLFPSRRARRVTRSQGTNKTNRPFILRVGEFPANSTNSGDRRTALMETVESSFYDLFGVFRGAFAFTACN